MRIGFVPREEDEVLAELEAGLATTVEDEEPAPITSYIELRVWSWHLELWHR